MNFTFYLYDIQNIILIKFEISSALSYFFSISNLICQCFTLNDTLCRGQDVKDKRKTYIICCFLSIYKGQNVFRVILQVFHQSSKTNKQKTTFVFLYQIAKSNYISWNLDETTVRWFLDHVRMSVLYIWELLRIIQCVESK